MAYSYPTHRCVAHAMGVEARQYMMDFVMEFLNRNIAIVPILMFLIGMLAGVTLTWMVMRR